MWHQLRHRFDGNRPGSWRKISARLGVVFGLALCVGATPVMAATFVVNSTGNGSDAVAGNGVCADAGGNCTLRAAITEANASAGSDTINFGISSGARTINVPAALDAITETVVINGTSQPGFAGVPLIQLTGSGGDSSFTGLEINADNCVVRGLVINGFSIGISITGMAENLIAQGNVVAGCYIGTNAAGSAIAALPNGYGIYLSDNGNAVGAGAQNNTIGGLTAADRNVISGNSNHSGIIINGTVTSGNRVQGNYIGTNAAGTAAVPNGYVAGIFILSAGNTIGGTTPAARNIISGNSNGIHIGGANAQNNIVQGNYIGTDVTGTAAIGNGTGIQMSDDTQNANSGARNNTIGGTVTGARNVISGNSFGLSIGNGFTQDSTTGNVVQGNRIGTNAAGTGALPNNLGVFITGGAKGNSIGGTVAGAGNTIAFNTSQGVLVGNNGVLIPNGNSIRGNSIYSNGGLGINLQPGGEADDTPTPNDALDADSGPNTLQNFPIITATSPTTSTTFIGGTLNSTPNQTFSLDFFRSPAADASGNGEGQTYLGNPVSGSTTVTTNSSGIATFGVTFNGNFIGQFLSATATSRAGDTSEFGPAVRADRTLSINDITVTEGNPPSNGAPGTNNATFTVTLSQSSAAAVTVQYITANGTATSPADYTASALTTLTFAPGETSKTLTVLVQGDLLDENNETFFVNLSNAGNAVIFDAQGRATIADDDAAPSLTISNPRAFFEGSASAPGSVTLGVRLSAPSSKTVKVNYLTVNGAVNGAIAGSDYVALTGTLTFNPGETLRTVTVQFIGDTVAELNESFFVDLKTPVNATIADSRGKAFIGNDDGPNISIDNAVSVQEGNSGTRAQNFVVKLSAASTNTVTVNWATGNGPATGGAGPADFTAATGTLTFAPGETQKTISIQVKGDTTVEPNEKYFVNLTRPTFAVIADSQGSGFILNDDVAPAIAAPDAPSK